MILKINGFENIIKFDDESVKVINISNPKLFSNIIETINEQINGIDSDDVLLLDDNNDILCMDKEMYILSDLFNIDYNSKKILNGLYNLISKNIEGEQNFELENLVLKIRNYLISEINELPVEITMKQELEITEILKMFSVKIDNSTYISVFERVELVINLLSTLKIANILVIPNLKQFLTEKELVEVYKYSLYNNINLLLIERNSSNKLKYEENFYIDNNFDDYIG